MIRITNDRWPQDYAKWAGYLNRPQKGDIQIDIPFLDYDQEEYANIYLIGDTIEQSNHFEIGMVKNIAVKCLCEKGEMVPKGGILYPNCEYIPQAIRTYSVSMMLTDKNDKQRPLQFRIENLAFLIAMIEKYVNPLLEEGYLVDAFDEEWMNWQFTTWNGSEANGQGRTFTFSKTDIYSLDNLYDYLKSFSVMGVEHALSNRGGGRTWIDIEVGFDLIDKYVNSLIEQALGSNAIAKGDKVYFNVEFNYESFEGYCPNYEKELSETESNKYREQIFKKLIIGVFRIFDLEKMKRMRFIHS
jgi:hypothetical protein